MNRGLYRSRREGGQGRAFWTTYLELDPEDLGRRGGELSGAGGYLENGGCGNGLGSQDQSESGKRVGGGLEYLGWAEGSGAG